MRLDEAKKFFAFKLNFQSKFLVILILWLCKSSTVSAYSVLTHEALIDAAWDKYLAPLLNQKYHLLPDQLNEAHAYAYGGAVAPDMGYYPFGSALFTDLVHYVRSGDYIIALLDEAQNANEYAFALGGLCHYYADVYGHRLGVNISVPVVYPKVKKKFGNTVTYEQDPTAHVRVEFSFDVVQTARGNYASQAYHNFIGFKVADSLMDRAFFKTYSFHLKDLFSNFSRAVRTFRWTVKNFIPEITKAAWAAKKCEIRKTGKGITARQFKYKMSKATYNKEFGRDRDKPKFFANLIAGIIRILPKIGPLKKFKIKAPGPVAEKYYIQSFDSVLLHYTNAITGLGESKLHLTNKDFDTGLNTSFGEYVLTDKTYKNLLVKLQENKFDSLITSLKQNIIDFFSKPDALQSIKETNDQKFIDALEALKKANSFKQIDKQ